jgi:nitrite reductase/ring-hydroxylating ferredoxin subunit
MQRVLIGVLADLPDGRGIAIELGGRRLAVFRVGERVFASDDHCSHRGFPLHDGVLAGTSVRCRTHGAGFDLASGAVLCGPARRPIRVYPTQLVEGHVYVELG